MLTLRTATVTISVPDAACTCAITACDGYLPVPTNSRDANVRPAMTRGVSRILSTTHEVDDLDRIAVGDDHLRKPVAPDDGEVVLDGDAPRVDLEFLQQRCHGNRFLDLEPVAVQGDHHVHTGCHFHCTPRKIMLCASGSVTRVRVSS